jgi:hypothetical protein
MIASPFPNCVRAEWNRIGDARKKRGSQWRQLTIRQCFASARQAAVEMPAFELLTLAASGQHSGADALSLLGSEP